MDGPPRILMLGYGWFPHRLGGLNRYYRDLIERMPEARGVVIGHSAQTPARVAGVSEHAARLPVRLLACWWAAQRAARTADVIDAHFALYSLAPVRVGALRRKPLLIHFQGPWADESASAGERSQVQLALKRALERAVYRRADAAIVLTSAFRQVLVERYGVAPWRVHVVPPGVDLDRFTPGSVAAARAELGITEDAFVAVSVRRLVPRMGLEVLAEAWGQALPALPAGSQLLIAGEGPAAGELTRLAESAGAGDSVRLLGRIDDRELVNVYRAADVAVVPSVAHEGFGLVVIEAAACGTPSIVTDVGGLPEAIAALDESLIVRSGNRDALAERLLASSHDRPSRPATREFAERFSWHEVVARHRRIIRRLARAGAAAAKGDREPLKVVYLDHVAQVSGGEIALLRLLPHLDHVQPHVILAEDGPLVGRLNRAGISVEVLPMADRARLLRKGEVTGTGVSARVAFDTVTYTARLAARLRRLAPDLVHTNSMKAGVYGSLAAKLAGIPIIWHVRDRIANDYLPAPAVFMIRQMTERLASAVVANSRSTLGTLAARTNSVVVYSVLPDVLTEVPSRNRPRNGPLRFGVIGRLAPWKGQDMFLRAFARAFPEGDEEAALVGGALFGPAEVAYADGLGRLADDLGIASRVEFRGHRDDVWGELSQIDVLVHSSVTAEPFGQVVLEGMAAGVPVIAAGAGGPAEILEHNVTGLLYRPADENSLAASMRTMVDPALRERLSGHARGALGPFSPQVVAAQLQDLYVKVVERNDES
jgi:glycosyltransferase involved in cell wall biosynthesis